MPTATEFMVLVRDEANINAAAVASVREQLLERLAVLEEWPETQVREDIVSRIQRTMDQTEAMQRTFLALRDGANEAAIALGGEVPPIDPIPEPGNEGIEWSTGLW